MNETIRTLTNSCTMNVRLSYVFNPTLLCSGDHRRRFRVVPSASISRSRLSLTKGQFNGSLAHVNMKTNWFMGHRNESSAAAAAASDSSSQTPSPAEKFEYQAEVRRLMDLIVNSLYSNKEVFLRELISNASDALDKLRYLSATDQEISKDAAGLDIRIYADKDNGIITITDSGIGMTRQELVDYLRTIAQSGAAKFMKALKDSEDAGGDNNLIGQLGVGFFSAFLVADRLIVSTKSPKSDKQYVWEGEANSSSFTIQEETDLQSLIPRGTRITLHLKQDAKNFADPERIQKLVKNYSQFVSFPIYIGQEKGYTKEALYLVEPSDEVAIQSLKAYKEKNSLDISKEDLDLGKCLMHTCGRIKKQLGDKVVQIINRLSSSFYVLVSGKFGWSAIMNRLMKLAQSAGDTISLEFMKWRRIALTKLAALFTQIGNLFGKSKQPSHLASVVKISTNCRTVDPLHPWCAPINGQFVGSGFVISGQRILTNAHVVTGATFVEVAKSSSGTNYTAKIIAFGHDCDLALLTIEDQDFWNDLEPLKLIGHMPNLEEQVFIVGYPIGGDSASITSGIISRVDTLSYEHNQNYRPLPVLQVDAAINEGNSGGPVFVGNDVIGVAFESETDGDNIGFVIPSPIVNLFLAGVEAKSVGFCSLGFSIQGIENHMMRDYLKMGKMMTGVLVTGSEKLLSGKKDKKTLKKKDVILEIDGLPIQNDERVFCMNKFWIHLDGYIALKKPGESVSLKILRMGEVMSIRMELARDDNWYLKDYPSPSYFIFGGFVFIATSYGVKISQVLEGDINKGYTSFDDLMVYSVNGKEVTSLNTLCKAIVEASTDYLWIDLELDQVIVIDIKKVKECHRQLLDCHKVMDGMSEDLQEAYFVKRANFLT